MKKGDSQDLPPCGIYIDKEGRWFYQGAEMVRRDIVRLFYTHMRVDSLGRCVVDVDGNACYVEVEDTPFVVWGVDLKNGDFFIHLSDGSVEELLPETLAVGGENVLYCTIKKGRFPARFNRPAYYQLARHIEEERGSFYLPAKGKRYRVRRRAAGSCRIKE